MITCFSSFQWVLTDFGLTVKWNGQYNVDIWLVGDYFFDQVEGLCGNMNDDKYDDSMNPAGQVVCL